MQTHRCTGRCSRAQHKDSCLHEGRTTDKQQKRIVRKYTALVLEGRGLERDSDKPEATQPAHEEAPKWDQVPPAAAKATHRIVTCRGQVHDRHPHFTSSASCDSGLDRADLPWDWAPIWLGGSLTSPDPGLQGQRFQGTGE